MNKLILLYGAGILSTCLLQTAAEAAPSNSTHSVYTDACYRETTRIHEEGHELSTKPCLKALMDREYESREDRSVKYHNLAVVQQAMGDLNGAFKSMQQSIAYTDKVDIRQVALAQLAHKLGQYETAAQTYRIILNAADPDLDSTVINTVARNYAKLQHQEREVTYRVTERVSEKDERSQTES